LKVVKNRAEFQTFFALPNFVGGTPYTTKAQLMLSSPCDVKACKNCSNSMCFVSFHWIPFPRISKF